MRKEALGYLKTASAALNAPHKFTPVAVFQLVALSIEGFLLEWLERHGSMPEHAGFRRLVVEFERHATLPDDLRRRILQLDQYQKLCEWIPVEPRQPSLQELPQLVGLAQDVEKVTADA